ncbi:hypothetical protein EJ08DRAFT_690859 [Tothia fuscella]|uniref:L-ornithine N(5)-monooxygenase n=1 Tax=Tothia fuscella TaxID=1048955 RepID=A0A9P4NEB5_9PEZI|nr:hypothetical protein EJ08DRAFT_690859 [Tothia fuscella]
MAASRSAAKGKGSKIYDVVIIGAGPCGLATAARLRESHPSALFTDEEQARYSWINRNGRQTSIKDYRSGKIRPASTARNIDMLVLDSTSASWMTRGNLLLEKLEIKYVRSPMFFHPDPQDRDALLAYCTQNKDESLCQQEIAGCVGREVSKHRKKRKAGGKLCPARINERERHDYFAPSATAFQWFCAECVERYSLQNVVVQDSVESLDYDFVPGIRMDEKRLFSLGTKKSAYLARTRGFAHALELESDHAIVPPRIRRRIRDSQATTVLVIGGGLTSAQVADSLLQQGVSKVILVLRGPLKIKPFDVDLAWVAKWRNQQKAAFWTADDIQERLAMAKAARDGGSVTPRFAKILRNWIAEGKLQLCTHTEWVIETVPLVTNMPAFEHVVFATGLNSDVKTMPVLRTINDKYPIESSGGLPLIKDNLMWRKDVPLFVTGKMAMLQVGPGAGNLEGARLCAERVAWGVINMLDEPCEDENDCCGGRDVSGSHESYVLGIGSKFDILDVGA